MTLILVAAGDAGQTLGPNRVVRVDRPVVHIGRGKDNDVVLPDHDRVLSSRHCSIENRDGRYYLTDLSTNGVFVNDSLERLVRGDSVRLNHGDRLRLGPYEFEVQIMAAGSPKPEEPPVAPDTFFNKLQADYAIAGEQPAPPKAPAPAPKPPPPLADPFGESRIDPLADVPGLMAPPADPGRDIIPDDIDLFADKSAGDDWRGPSEPDHVPSEQAFYAPPRVLPDAPPAAGQNIIPDDWDKDAEGAAPSAPAQPPRPVPSRAGREAAAEPAPPVPAAVPPMPAEGRERAVPFQPKVQTPDSVAPPPAAPGAGLSAGALRAFLVGAGLANLAIPDGEADERMEMLGRLFREVVTGLREVLMTRASIKSEMHVEQTMIRPKDNNPLKFSVSDDDAMTALLKPAGSGFLPGDKAVQQALNDIRAHELAVMAGVQEVLGQLLKRFDPESLEQRLKQSALLPASRKAKNWDAYVLLYGEIAREAADDFDTFFGRAFARAYQEQLKKL